MTTDQPKSQKPMSQTGTSGNTSPFANVTLGEFLRQARERRGVAIEQVASATKINVKMLHALEADQYSQLPARPFVRGFVRSYARFVGVDSQEVLIHFDPFISQKLTTKAEETAATDAYALEKRSNEQSKTLLWFVMGGFVLVGGIIILALKPSLKHQKQTPIEQLRAIHASAEKVQTTHADGDPKAPAPASQSTTAAASESSTASAAVEAKQPVTAPVAEPVAPKAQTTEAKKVAAEEAEEGDESEASAATEKEDELNSGRNIPPAEIKHRVVLKFGERSWVRYQSDKRQVMKMLLFKDAVLVLRARNMIRVQTSSPETTQFSYNRQGYQPFGKAHQMAVKQGTPTLIFPMQASEKIEEPFPGEGPLPPAPSAD